MPRWLLPAAIVLLALADGVLHLMLDVLIFRGNFFGPLGPPPGAAPSGPRPPGPPIPLPLPLNQLFVLNFVGYIVLAILFWYAVRWFGRRAGYPLVGAVDVALILYALVSILGWVDVNMPNPMGLGYLSKALEVVLIVAVAAHLLTVRRLAAGSSS